MAHGRGRALSNMFRLIIVDGRGVALFESATPLRPLLASYNLPSLHPGPSSSPLAAAALYFPIDCKIHCFSARSVLYHPPRTLLLEVVSMGKSAT